MRWTKIYKKNIIWLVVSTRLKNMKVSWDDCSEYMENKTCSKPPTRNYNGNMAKKTFWTLHLESEKAAKQDLFSIDYPNDLGKLKYSTNLNSSATHLPFPGPCPAE